MAKSHLYFSLIIGVSLCLLTGSATAAGFAKIGSYVFNQEPYFHGTRTAALGSADLTNMSGPMAILHNPAVQREGNTFQISYEQSDWTNFQKMVNWGLSAEWNRFRFGLVRHELDGSGLPVRTAYLPEGTGETFDLIQRIWTTGFSAEILPNSWQDHGFTAVVGANWRHYWERTFSLEGDQGTGDLGLNTGWRYELDDGWFTLNMAYMRRNFNNATLTMQDQVDPTYEYNLPAYTQSGITLVRTWLLPDGGGEAVRLLVAYSHREEAREEEHLDFQADRWGVELVALDILALRWGDHNDPLSGAMSETMGVGLKSPRGLLGPLTLELDWTGFDTGYDRAFTGGWRDLFGVTIGARF